MTAEKLIQAPAATLLCLFDENKWVDPAIQTRLSVGLVSH